MKKVLIECVLIAICGAVFALGANTLSPKGLSLSRNYFPVSAVKSPALPPATGPTAISLTNTVAQRLALHGLQLVDSNFVSQAFHSFERAQNLIVFVDARDDALYRQGHIPGAYQLDYYRPEGYLSSVLPAVTAANQVILYCNGGECEDSELAAILLRDSGVPAEKLHVYGGGFTQWSSNNLPVEIGARDSQQLRQQ